MRDVTVGITHSYVEFHDDQFQWFPTLVLNNGVVYNNSREFWRVGVKLT